MLAYRLSKPNKVAVLLIDLPPVTREAKSMSLKGALRPTSRILAKALLNQNARHGPMFQTEESKKHPSKLSKEEGTGKRTTQRKYSPRLLNPLFDRIVLAHHNRKHLITTPI